MRTWIVAGALALAWAGCSDDDDTTAAAPSTGGDGTDDGDNTDDGAAADPASVVQAAGWADNVTITLSGDSFTFESDGLPDHGALDAYALMGGDTIGVSATDISLEIPLNPVVAASTTEAGLGAIGAAISGAVFFNPYEGDGTTVALEDNFEVDGAPFIDSCNGHPLGTGDTYHYHGIPYCITDVVDTPGEHSTLIGYLLDGFPVYGPNEGDDSPPTDLDDCSSHEGPTPEHPQGVRHYHLTETAPYSIPCYVGEVSASNTMGTPPGGGGPPPGM